MIAGLVTVFLGGVEAVLTYRWYRTADRLLREVAKADQRRLHAPTEPNLPYPSLRARGTVHALAEGWRLLAVHVEQQADPRLETLRRTALRRMAFAVIWLWFGWIPTVAVLAVLVILLGLVGIH